MSSDSPDPYRVVVAENPCEHCKRGEVFAVVGPDEVELGRTFDDEADADEYAEALNGAYHQGRLDEQNEIGAGA